MIPTPYTDTSHGNSEVVVFSQVVLQHRHHFEVPNVLFSVNAAKQETTACGVLKATVLMSPSLSMRTGKLS
ncbi:hypothetical protein BN1723_015346 [Verticillium longisporum]|uniref:Uncharacterized protein n=1 Tax=Verticillium longisporum TaxID=100787 RepID=A0A0G4MWE7_VERLO|nr:hypothetical protein BN1723_015346 [Verticillium longisporum]